MQENENERLIVFIIVLIILIMVITGIVYRAESNRIPDTEINLSDKQVIKAKLLSPVRLTYPELFTITCYNHQPGIISYYITAKGSDMSQREAYWNCAEYIRCPRMELKVIDNKVFATDINASLDEYSKKEIKACGTFAIQEAVDYKRTTPAYLSDELIEKNRNSWTER